MIVGHGQRQIPRFARDDTFSTFMTRMPHASLVRRRGVLPFIALAVFACTPRVAATPAPASQSSPPRAGATCCLQQGLAIASHHRVAAIAERRFTQQQLWTAIEP